MKKLAEYLGTEVAVFLNDERFKGWKVERTQENELEPPVVYYVFPERGLELECDADERICTIFLRTKDGDTFDDKLISPDLSLNWNRQQVLQHLGPPSWSGPEHTHQILGAYGAWNRFDRPRCVIHVKYLINADGIDEITLIRPERAPVPRGPGIKQHKPPQPFLRKETLQNAALQVAGYVLLMTFAGLCLAGNPPVPIMAIIAIPTWGLPVMLGTLQPRDPSRIGFLLGLALHFSLWLCLLNRKAIKAMIKRRRDNTPK
jgi:hypothetical protein